MDIKGYLKCAMQLEASIYEQNNVVAKIKNNICALENPTYAATETKIKLWDAYNGIGDFLSSLILVPIGCTVVGGILGILVWFIAIIFGAGLSYPKGFINSIVTCAVIGFIASIVIFVIDERRRHDANTQINANNRQAAQYNAAIQNNNPPKIARLRTQLTKAEQNLSSTRGMLSRLYAKNVIHLKYRNFVAVSMMYEYYDTGRCVSLQGHGGAYDTYENEIRQNIIICKLDVIIDKLDQIIDNQYSLYQAISECNRNISKVNRGLSALQQTNSKILECAEVTAYNSRITAANTSLMSTLMVYDRI